jgi:hypothetical protein
MRTLLSRKSLALAAAATLTASLVLAGALNPWSTSAAQPPFDCPNIQNSLQFPIGKCAFTNLAVHPVNDIHIVFDGLVVKLSSSPASSCRLRLLLPRSGGFKSVYNCWFVGPGRGSSSIQPFDTFSMTVLNLNPQHPDGAHIDSWFWTVNGTPVTITPTGTKTSTSTPTVTGTNTSTPTPTDTPTPTPAVPPDEPIPTDTPDID